MGRHDAPDLFGAMYVAEDPVSAVCEQLARFRGRGLSPDMLERRGHRLALVRMRVPDIILVDLDDPATLLAQTVRPSEVATRNRTVTQDLAVRLYGDHEAAHGLRWWSTLEASWINVTLFAERVSGALSVGRARALDVDSDVVVRAAEALGLG